jgi:Arc/MetJ-type ribon-helix-helix transcriptional regulator
VPNIEVSLPDRVDSEIDRLVEQGDFINREQAIEELLSMGMSAYDANDTSTEDDEWVTQDVSEHQDPALQDDFDDGPTF